MAGHEVGAGAPASGPEGDARAVQGRLGEPGPGRDAVERVLADLGERQLEQFGAGVLDELAHTRGMAALARKQERGSHRWERIRRRAPPVKRNAPTTPRDGAFSAKGRGV